MSFESTLAEINVFCEHENAQISEYAQRMASYAQALKSGECSAEEYAELTGDLDQLQAMARTADEQNQVVKIFECVKLLPSLL